MTTKKGQRSRRAEGRMRDTDARAAEWNRVHAAVTDAADWALDLAGELVGDYPEELVAVERVRQFVHARLAGLGVPLELDDLLLVMALVIQSIGHGHVTRLVEAIVDPVATSMGLPRAARRPVPRHCPGAPSARCVRDPYIHAAA
jgi:hypothetical protein